MEDMAETGVNDDKKWKDSSPPPEWKDSAAPPDDGQAAPVMRTEDATRPGVLKRINDWYTKETDIPNDPYAIGKGVLPAGGTQRESLRSAVGNTALMSAVPMLGPALGAPVTTGLGIIGGVGGSKLGRMAGEEIGAPEIGEDIGGLAGSFFGAGLGSAGSSPRMRDYLGSKMRLPEATPAYPKGRLTPGTRAVARLLGAGAGHMTGIPGIGEFGGWVLGPGVADMLIPEHPNMPGISSKIPTRMPKMGIESVAKPSPFEGMSSSAKPMGSAELPPVTSTEMVKPTVRMVEKFEAPKQAKSSIIQPGTKEAQAPHVEGSYWSFKEPALRKAVMGGDRDAAIVYKQRFGELPQGASLLTDVSQGPTRGLYRSR